MKTLLLSFLVVFTVALASAPTLGAGWFWDVGNAFGFVAFAGLAFLSIASARKHHVAVHRYLGNVVLLITALHVFWLLLGDPAAVEYIKPGAPYYMWAGVAAFVLLNVLMIVELPEYRRRVHNNHHTFRTWHRWLSIGVIAASAWHIVGAGHYLSNPYQAAGLILAAAIVCFGYRLGWDNHDLDGHTPRLFLGLAVISTLTFTFLRNLTP